MSRRAVRLLRRPGRPWQKEDTRSLVQTGWTTSIADGMPWVPVEARLDGYQRCVEQTGDAAALVEAVRHCRETGETVPVWVVKELEVWLSEFVAGETPQKYRPNVKRPVFGPWGRTYRRAWRDFIVADQVETNRRVYGMTWEEALDEASCHFRGTELAGSPEILKKASQRARRRARQGWFQRLITSWESRVPARIDPLVSARSPRRYWWIVNAGRQGVNRGEWLERPRLLAHLSAARLQTEAQKVTAHWRQERGRKRR